MSSKPAPALVGTFKVICWTTIDHRHRFTGNTKQIVDGELMGAMSGLAICQAGAEAYYLFGCDADWNVMTDTYHASVSEARDQAEFEYFGVSKTRQYARQ